MDSFRNLYAHPRGTLHLSSTIAELKLPITASFNFRKTDQPSRRLKRPNEHEFC